MRIDCFTLKNLHRMISMHHRIIQNEGCFHMHILLLHIIGTIGGLLFRKFKMPAGALIGAMVFVTIYNSVTKSTVDYPQVLRTIMQICSGLIIASRLRKHDISNLKTMIAPVIILIVMLLGFTIGFSFIMKILTDLSASTIFFATAPGGMTDLTIIAADFGATVEQVALLQLFRLVFVIAVFPPMMRHFYLKRMRSDSLEAHLDEPIEKPKKNVDIHYVTHLLLLLMIAAAGGLLFKVIGIPAGAILGAVCAIVVYNVRFGEAFYPKPLMVIIQIAAGCYIGSKIGVDTFTALPSLMIPVGIMIVEVFAMAVITAFIIHTTCKLDYTTALFSCIPGGITETSIIAEELGLDTPKIVIMHTFRIVATISLMPPIVLLLEGRLI